MPHSAVSAEWRVFFRTFGENDIRQQVITDASVKRCGIYLIRGMV